MANYFDAEAEFKRLIAALMVPDPSQQKVDEMQRFTDEHPEFRWCIDNRFSTCAGFAAGVDPNKFLKEL
jgi:hypothetical protein